MQCMTYEPSPWLIPRVVPIVDDGGVVQDGHKDFRAIDGIMSKTLKEISD